MTTSALLALEDGTLWPGQGFGAVGDATGEIVFNTSLTGYQEILTDPSYHGQLITMTMPHIGNSGVTPEDEESDRVWAAGLVVRSISPLASNWRARQSLPDYLAERGVVAMTDADTRALVRHIRTHGAMRAALSSADPDPERLLAAARNTRDMTGLDLVSEVTCAEPYRWTEGQGWWRPDGGAPDARPGPKAAFHVVAYDYGVKRNILRLLAARGCRMTVVPATTPAAEVLALEPDGIFLSNGPGDPAAVTYAISAVRELLGKKPLFGICLGHQILALALGATTYKLKFGHRGGNQPVQVVASGAVQISSHNHGFAVDATTLPAGTSVSHVNLNDRCCEGLIALEHHAFSVQYHPESAPGPHDSDQLFDRFIEMMERNA
ncbi:MAG: glutamine-hydrolyzing carbamoyl-phosphate synthase small subunit [Anaerolineae bacterium]|nr:glutamine-hydrolyzing carbamoyl-phosphate synthase small subunit [Anaerolineae bacterium]